MNTNHGLIPITKIKVTKEKWLNTPIKYDDELNIKDIIEQMSLRTYEWIKKKPDLEYISDYDSFKKDFINLMYNKYLK